MLFDIFLSSIDLSVGSYKIKEDKGQTRSNILRKPQFFQRRSNAYFLEQSKYWGLMWENMLWGRPISAEHFYAGNLERGSKKDIQFLLLTYDRIVHIL